MKENKNYLANIKRRRQFSIEGYAGLSDVGLDGNWVTPYQIAARSEDGPVLLTYNYLDAPSAQLHREELRTRGFLASMAFNKVLDLALLKTGLVRRDLYLTHAFHLLPRMRSQRVPIADIYESFDAIGRHEVEERQVIALGNAAATVCRRFGILHEATAHLSARGLSYDARASVLAEALAPWAKRKS